MTRREIGSQLSLDMSFSEPATFVQAEVNVGVGAKYYYDPRTGYLCIGELVFRDYVDWDEVKAEYGRLQLATKGQARKHKIESIWIHIDDQPLLDPLDISSGLTYEQLLLLEIRRLQRLGSLEQFYLNWHMMMGAIDMKTDLFLCRLAMIAMVAGRIPSGYFVRLKGGVVGKIKHLDVGFSNLTNEEVIELYSIFVGEGRVVLSYFDRQWRQAERVLISSLRLI